MKLAEVVTLYADNRRDMPLRMREAADQIETETDEHDRTVGVLSIHAHESGDVRAFGWGDVDPKGAVWMLVNALAKMVVPPDA